MNLKILELPQTSPNELEPELWLLSPLKTLNLLLLSS